VWLGPLAAARVLGVGMDELAEGTADLDDVVGPDASWADAGRTARRPRPRCARRGSTWSTGSTEALRTFHGEALVLWAPDNRVMPPEHGPRLAALLPAGRLVELPGCYVLSMLDDPAAVAAEMGAFLTTSAASWGA